MKVLVVGAPDVARGMLQSFLRRADCTVLVCGDAREALALADDARPDLIALLAQGEAADSDAIAGLRALRDGSAAPGGPLVAEFDGDPREALERIAGLLGVARRERVRRALRLRVDFYGPGDLQGVGHTRDLSESGMFLRSDRPLAAGDPLQLIFTLPLPERPTVRAAGEVVHRPAASGPAGGGVGVRFRKLGERDRRALAGLIGAAGGAGT